MSEVLGVQCTACGTKRKHKGLRYHPETFLPFCENAWVCSDTHPNSPINLIKRQSQLALLEYHEASTAYGNGVVTVHSDKLRRLLNNPLTVRITSVDMAEFLIRESETSQNTISDLVRGFIETMMGKRETFDKPVKQEKPIAVDITDDELTF
jgi:hypothetical protein